MTEHEMYMQIADYMRYQYPKVIYRFDLAADLKLSIGQAKKHKRLQGRRGYPDLFIAEPKVRHTTDGEWGIKLGWAQLDDGSDYYAMMFAGLMIELKRDGTRLKKKSGEWASDHIKEQAEVLHELRQRGYKAEFACGFDEAKKIIDEYLG